MATVSGGKKLPLFFSVGFIVSIGWRIPLRWLPYASTNMRNIGWVK
jgi:hypothetical protein